MGPSYGLRINIINGQVDEDTRYGVNNHDMAGPDDACFDGDLPGEGVRVAVDGRKRPGCRSLSRLPDRGGTAVRPYGSNPVYLPERAGNHPIN